MATFTVLVRRVGYFGPPDRPTFPMPAVREEPQFTVEAFCNDEAQRVTKERLVVLGEQIKSLNFSTTPKTLVAVLYKKRPSEAKKAS